VNTALVNGNGFTRSSRSQYVTVNGSPVWQPAGGPDYFTGIEQLTNAFALEINRPISIAVVDSDGRTTKGQVFAAINTPDGTSRMIRKITWNNLDVAWSGTNAFEAG
jgi:hypothetical protein